METTGPEPLEVIFSEPLFRDTLRGPEEERVDYLTFARTQPKTSDVMRWVLSHLRQIPELANLKLQLIYVKEDHDRIAVDDFDTINALAEQIGEPYARLNWVASPRDTGGSAIFMRESGREPCELQLITAAEQPTVDPVELLDFVVSQYESSISPMS